MTAKTQRLNTALFDQVIKSGASYYTNKVSLKLAPVSSNMLRLAFVVSKKELKRAVDRNRLKRRVRHAVLKRASELPLGYGIIFFPKKTLLKAPFSEIESEVALLLKRAKVL